MKVASKVAHDSDGSHELLKLSKAAPIHQQFRTLSVKFLRIYTRIRNINFTLAGPVAYRVPVPSTNLIWTNLFCFLTIVSLTSFQKYLNIGSVHSDLKSDSRLSPWKSWDGKCLFHVEGSCRFQDIHIFVPTILVKWESGLVKKLRSISKFMTSQTGIQIIKIHILPNFLKRKGN